MTALHIAAKNGHQKIVEALIDQGANINATDNLGLSPISWAIGQGQKEIVRQFIGSNSNIDESNEIQQNHLATALQSRLAEPKKTEIIKLLLSSGISAENTSRSQHTEIAVYKKNPIQYILNNNDTDKNKIKALQNLEKQSTEKRIKIICRSSIENLETPNKYTSTTPPITTPTPSITHINTQQRTGVFARIRASLGL